MNEAVQTLPNWLQEIYPFEPKRFDTGRGVMSYLDEGSGDEAVLMVHGNPTWSFYYRNLVLGLRGKIRCIAPDHIGCGLSDKPQDFNYTLSEHIKNLRALIESLGLKRVHLIVHDWGGPIGLGTMLEMPHLFGKVVILNTAAFADTVVPWRIRLCRAPLIGELLVRGFNGFAGPAAWMSVTKPLTAEVKRGFLFPYDNWANRIATHRFVVDIPSGRGTSSDVALARIEEKLPMLNELPVRILWGGEDFCFNRHYYDRWRELLPNAAATYDEKAGHYVLEDASEACLKEIERFLGR
ncbi:alpha/beta fold hydrolase [Oleiharenicola lentus]|uniref:alpha/beta fold hydrolase n=1 Tax=Oleiharenicola lentus TaxID=2508720 RepID=UPI003F66ACE5